MDESAGYLHGTEQASSTDWKLHLAVRILSPQPASPVSMSNLGMSEMFATFQDISA
jgi:hypothetical protein